MLSDCLEKSDGYLVPLLGVRLVRRQNFVLILLFHFPEGREESAIVRVAVEIASASKTVCNRQACLHELGRKGGR